MEKNMGTPRKKLSRLVAALLCASSLLATSLPALALENQEVAPISDVQLFAPQTLTLTPGATQNDINFTWYSDRGEQNNTAVVQMAPAASVVDGQFPADALTATGTRGDASTGKSWHKAGITGLTPATQYLYRVSSDGTSFSESYAYTTGAEGEFTFAYTGDPQLTTGMQDSDSDTTNVPRTTTKEGWQRTVDKILELMPDARFIANAGDQVDSTSTAKEAEYDNFFAPQQLRSLPVAPAVGNHDRHYPFIYHYNLPNELAYTDTGSAGTTIDKVGNYWYRYNDALFVVLNLSAYPASTEAADAYGQLFDQTLSAATAANPDAKWLFVMQHKSTASPASHQNDADLKFWTPTLTTLMDKYDVDFVLAGHDHVYSRSWSMLDGKKVEGIDYSADTVNDPAGTIYFTANTASGLKYYDILTKKDPNGWVEWNEEGTKPHYTNIGIQALIPQFIQVDVSAEKVSFTTYRADNGAVLDTYSVTKTGAETPASTVSFGVSTNADTNLAGQAQYALSVANAKNLLNLSLSFQVDGNLLSGKDFELAQGFTSMDDSIRWVEKENGLWEGSLMLAYTGSREGLTAETAEIIKLNFTPKALGDAKLEITALKAAVKTGENQVGYVEHTLKPASATTSIIKVYSIFDLTQDGTVDALDLAIAQLAYLAQNTDGDWQQYKTADVNEDGKVDVADLLLIYSNFTR